MIVVLLALTYVPTPQTGSNPESSSSVQVCPGRRALLSCIAEDGERAQIYSDAWEWLVPTTLVVYVDKEENGEGGGTVVPKPKQGPMRAFRV